MEDMGDPDDYYVLSVLNGAFGESMSSRLFQDLREKQGLCYAVYSGFSLDRGLGVWLAQASSSPRHFPKLLEKLDRQIDAVAEGGEGAFTEEEVSESVSRIAGLLRTRPRRSGVSHEAPRETGALQRLCPRR